MDWQILVGILIKLVLVFIAMEIGLRWSRRMDRRNGRDFKAQVLPQIAQDPRALADYYGKRFIGICLMIGACFLSLLVMVVILPIASADAGGLTSKKYDDQIARAVRDYWPDRPGDVAGWKAQLYQESRLDPDARSPVGAEGLAQFMPATWGEITKAMGYGLVDRRQAEPSIRAGAYYMAQLRKGWSSPRPAEDRQKLAQASYNAGMGPLLAAQKACANGGAPPAGYDAIVKCLPAVFAGGWRETLGYVDRIAKWRAMIQAGL